MTTSTIPAWIVSTYLHSLPETQRAFYASELSHCGRQVGERVEIDTDAARATNAAPIVDDLLDYWRLCDTFWQRHGDGRAAGEYLAVRRGLVSFVQSTTNSRAKDLREQMDALLALPGVGLVVDELLEANPDYDRVQTLGRDFNVNVTVDGAVTTARLVVDGNVIWSKELGGAPTQGEVRRVITLTVNHAAWRDRKVRRLAQVQVDVDEIWPVASRLMH